MTQVALTGARGFLGWHTRCAAHAHAIETRPIALGDAFVIQDAADAISGASRFIHLAGVNRGTEVADGNLHLAEQAAAALISAERPPAVVVFANSIQAGNGSAYGEAKRDASDILRAAAENVGADYVDELLPNLFGEHGRPFYNSVVATFAHQLAHGEQPRIDQDRELTLLHVQNAAELLLGLTGKEDCASREARETVTGVLGRLSAAAQIYLDGGQFPDLADTFDRDLFNTFRAAAFTETTPIRLDRHADARGSFFEIARSHGGEGQSSFSTTAPGIVRGQHYHRRKVERFTVLAGEAVISLRRLFTDEVHEFRVNSDEPMSIDMPTLWAHNIENVGDSTLYTSFWANELFDPQNPDTIAEPV